MRSGPVIHPCSSSEYPWHTASSRDRKWVEMDFLSGCGAWERSTEDNQLQRSHPDHGTCASSTLHTQELRSRPTRPLSELFPPLHTALTDVVLALLWCFVSNQSILSADLDEWIFCCATYFSKWPFPVLWSYLHSWCNVIYRCRGLA